MARIASFHQPPLTQEEEELYKNSFPFVETCEPNKPLDKGNNNNRLIIKFLQVQDIKVVPFHENVFAVSDYYKGLIFYELKCSTTNCSYRPLTTLPPGSIFDENFSQI
jgi:hypothetical protein